MRCYELTEMYFMNDISGCFNMYEFNNVLLSCDFNHPGLSMYLHAKIKFA